MPGYGNVIDVTKVGNDVHLLICLHSIGNKEGNWTISQLPYHGVHATKKSAVRML